MKIVLTGGGTGGHFFPLIAVAEEIRALIDERKLLPIKLYYMSDAPYDKRALFENGIHYVSVPAGKNRLYGGIQNYIDMLKLIPACIIAILKLFFIYPDVVFSKGGYASFPTLFAARVLRIPVIIHESDTVPGRVSLWSAKFAKKIALAHPRAGAYFPTEKTAYVGIPIRKNIREKGNTNVHEYFEFNSNIKTVFVIGGSSGAEYINDVIVDGLPIFLKDYQVIHQAGAKLYEEVKNTVDVVVTDKTLLSNYRLYGLMNPVEMKMAAGCANIVITRAGSTSLAEISLWGIPCIVIPLPESISRDQKSNAYEFAHTGAGIVIEQANLNVSILKNQIDTILSNPNTYNEMSQAALKNGRPDAARLIAEELIRITLDHQK
jgi:UDP-N-acetylglucosamine--N-acetylmuramyl-(pentapeptide) pyrophosphoryl-undecaprenol N-acetylglucosamine transferase